MHQTRKQASGASGLTGPSIRMIRLKSVPGIFLHCASAVKIIYLENAGFETNKFV